MNPPSVLLDLTFLTAVADPDDDNHEEATAIYRGLIDDFLAQRNLLVGRADHLATVARADLFAPVDKLHVAGQHRHAAQELMKRTDAGIDEAITLVLIKRCKIRKVATYDERLRRYDFELVTASSPVPATADVDASTT
ncbi:MAG TPA: hypothetical protein VGC84_16460 [Ilumatobacteraceae bacterium]|jgi:predicted nucleic acid-binding protein